MSSPEIAEEHRLVGRIYAAALDNTLWPEVLAAVIAQCGGRTGSMFLLDMLNPAINFFVPHGLPESLLRDYREKGYDQLEFEFHREIMAPYIPGLAVAGYRKAGSQENYRQRLGAVYTEIYRPSGVEYVIGAILVAGDYKWSAIGLHRSLEQGEFPEDALQRLTRLATHIARAIQVQLQLLAAQRGSEPLYELLDVMNTGVVLLDGECRVVRSNRVAGATMRAHGGLQPDTLTGLRAADPQANESLQSLLRDAINGSGRFGGVLAAPHAGSAHPLQVTVMPLAASGLHPELGRDGIRVAVFLTDPGRARVVPETILAQMYGVTAAEAAVANLLLNGQDAAGIAAQRGVSVDTVRDQLKSLYARTRTGGQAELVRLLAALANDFSHIPEPTVVVA